MTFNPMSATHTHTHTHISDEFNIAVKAQYHEDICTESPGSILLQLIISKY
jgi:hypothetical protein